MNVELKCNINLLFFSINFSFDRNLFLEFFILKHNLIIVYNKKEKYTVCEINLNGFFKKAVLSQTNLFCLFSFKFFTEVKFCKFKYNHEKLIFERSYFI